MEANIRNVLFKQNGELQFLIAVDSGIGDQFEGHLTIDALDFDPTRGEVETTIWEEKVTVPPGRTLNVLARIPVEALKKRVHCREIQYEVKLKPSGSLGGEASSFRSPRMVSTFEHLPFRSTLEEELKRKKITAYREYMKETR